MSIKKQCEEILKKLDKDSIEYQQVLSLYNLYLQKCQMQQQINALKIQYRLDELYKLYVG